VQKVKFLQKIKTFYKVGSKIRKGFEKTSRHWKDRRCIQKTTVCKRKKRMGKGMEANKEKKEKAKKRMLEW
jgi:hypothetical protein